MVARRLIDGLREDLQDGRLARLAGGRLGREGGLAEALNMANEIPEVNALHRRDVEDGAVFEAAAGVAGENRAVAGLETRGGQQRALEFLPGHLDGSVRHPSGRHRRRREQHADSGGNGNGAGFDAKRHDRPPGSPPDFEGASISVISVRAGGFEPPRCRHQQDLNLPRMPFRHARWASARLAVCNGTSRRRPRPAAGRRDRWP